MLIISLIRVDLQPSGSYIRCRHLPVFSCLSCALSTTLSRIMRRLVRLSMTKFLAFSPEPWTVFAPPLALSCSYETMNTSQAIGRMREVIRRQHKALLPIVILPLGLNSRQNAVCLLRFHHCNVFGFNHPRMLDHLPCLLAYQRACGKACRSGKIA